MEYSNSPYKIIRTNDFKVHYREDENARPTPHGSKYTSGINRIRRMDKYKIDGKFYESEDTYLTIFNLTYIDDPVSIKLEEDKIQGKKYAAIEIPKDCTLSGNFVLKSSMDVSLEDQVHDTPETKHMILLVLLENIKSAEIKITPPKKSFLQKYKILLIVLGILLIFIPLIIYFSRKNKMNQQTPYSELEVNNQEEI